MSLAYGGHVLVVEQLIISSFQTAGIGGINTNTIVSNYENRHNMIFCKKFIHGMLLQRYRIV